MEGDIKAFDTSYWDFFRKASASHIIPTLQRPYTWGKVQVEQLWDDILESDEPYYIGSIVAIRSSRTTQRDEIIDGQQRLTTLSLILVAVREYIKSKKALDDVRDDILSLLSQPLHGAAAQPRLAFSSENSNILYTALVDGKSTYGKTKAQANFAANLRAISAALRKYSPKCKPSEIRSLMEKIKELQIVFIECKSREAAYKLFESINARSVTLASTDLIKNRIFAVMHQAGSIDLEEAERSWHEMELDFNEDFKSLKTFIRHHWISLGRYTSHAKLFRSFEEYLEEEEGSASKYLDSLVAASKIYLSLRRATLDNLQKLPNVRFEREEIRQSLEFLSYLGVDQVYSVLLYLYQNDPKNFKRDLNRLVAFEFLYTGSPSEPEKKYFASFTAEDINKQKMFNGLFSLCKGQEQKFMERLPDRLYYTEGKSGDIQFVLEKYLFHLGGPKAFKEPTIEHIISQKAGDKVLNKLGSSKKQIAEVLHSLGNLTILEKTENTAEYRNKPFVEKQKLFKSSLFKGNKKICKYSFVTNPQQAIKKRGKDIGPTIFEIFLEVIKTGKWKTGLTIEK